MLIVLISAIVVFLFARSKIGKQSPTSSITANVSTSSTTVRYVALGDSYTIGEGLSAEKNFPSQLVAQLKTSGVDISLIENPSRTGWTTQDVLDQEMPIYTAAKPQFSTLLIGVNDWVQGVDSNTFRTNFAKILDQMLAGLQDKQNLIVITIPDFGVTPTGAQYANGKNISQGITEFNQIIQEESQKKNVKVIDIFSLSQGMKDDLINPDGLHPSAKEYTLWTTLIYPEALTLLNKN